MTVAAALNDLDRAWAATLSAADTLRLTLHEDAPALTDRPSRAGGRREAPPKPVEAAAELTTDAVAALDAAVERMTGVDHDALGADDVLGIVSFAQDRWLEVSTTLARLTSPERVLELADFVRRHGGEWRGWFASVLAGIADLDASARETERALAGSWCELAEQTAMAAGAHRDVDGPARPRQAGRAGAVVALRPVPSAPRTGDH